MAMQIQKTIRNCPVKFAFECPRTWDALTPTDDAKQRFCDQCAQMVYFCTTDEETIARAKAGDCIARAIPDRSELPEMVLGRALPVEPTEDQRVASQLARREHGIDDSIKNADAERSCPQCGYPAPPWRVDCRVCGFVMGRIPMKG